jgi:hypothetical protein
MVDQRIEQIGKSPRVFCLSRCFDLRLLTSLTSMANVGGASASAATPCSRLPGRRVPVNTVARSSENTIWSMHWISSSILGVSVSRLRSASLKRRCVSLRAYSSIKRTW